MRDLKDNPEPGRYSIHLSIPKDRELSPKIGEKVSLEVLGASPSESLGVRITEILDKGETFRGSLRMILDATISESQSYFP